MGNLDYENRAPLYKAAVAAAKAREEQEMSRQGRREGVDLWNRIVGPRGDANSGTGYTLKEGPGSDGDTDPSDIVSRGWRERANEKLRQDTAALKKYKASLGSGKELPDPLASSYEEAIEQETYKELPHPFASSYEEAIEQETYKELPHPFASSYEEAEADETYGLHRGYGKARQPR